MTVASLDWLQDAKDLEADLSGLTVHLKLDTGMGRIGFRKIADLLQAIAILEELEYDIEGVYTHFATADEVDQAHFESQLSVLKNFGCSTNYSALDSCQQFSNKHLAC